MSRKTYTTNPDGRAVLDVDRGSGDASTKLAAVLSDAEARERRDVRNGARGLDATVETMPGLNRQQRDRERAMPRDVTDEVPDPRMERTLPAEGAVRVPMSGRQRSARSVTKRAVQSASPATHYTAVQQLLTEPARWRSANDALSDAAGDVQILPAAQIAQVQRTDRAIMAYERASNRSHVVYANVQMPAAVNTTNLGEFTRNTFQRGSVLAFDRFTAGAHDLHDVERDDSDAHRTAVFEIQTGRGVYLGQSSGGGGNTAHLLPRGLELRVVGTHTATYIRPDGSTGRRHVIQLTDHAPQQGETS